MIVAGEASGDAHAARLVESLREKSPSAVFEFFGATGAKTREAGVETVVNADDLAIVGVPEIARALPIFWDAFQKLKQSADERQPDAAILVDFPDFNLKLAKALKNRGVKVIYYISPQLWAWRRYRARTIAKSVDLLLAILPFEKGWYAERGIAHVEFVGNPLAGEVTPRFGKEEFCAKHGLNSSTPIIALLPGSRHKELVRILPVLLETACRMAGKRENLQFVVALARARKLSEVKNSIAEIEAKSLKLPRNFIVVQDETREALNAADVAAVTSGTATLETAIIGTPLAIVYKTSTFNYLALRPLISVPHYGLVNLIAGERVAAELIQKDFTPERLASELFRLLEPEENSRMRQRLRKIVADLGAGGAADRAAEAVLRELEKS